MVFLLQFPARPPKKPLISKMAQKSSLRKKSPRFTPEGKHQFPRKTKETVFEALQKLTKGNSRRFT